MNYWKAEELAQLTYAEWQRKLETEYLQVDFSAEEVCVPFISRATLKLSDWLIATGESLKQRYKKTAPASYQVNVRKFAR